MDHTEAISGLSSVTTRDCVAEALPCRLSGCLSAWRRGPEVVLPADWAEQTAFSAPGPDMGQIGGLIHARLNPSRLERTIATLAERLGGRMEGLAERMEAIRFDQEPTVAEMLAKNAYLGPK